MFLPVVRSVSKILPPSRFSSLKKFLNALASSASPLVLFFVQCNSIPNMLKYAFNFVVQGRFIPIAAESGSLRRLSFRKGTTLGRRYFNQTKFRPPFEKALISPVFKSHNFSFKKPAILFGGILSFFGYEKLPDEPELILKIKRGILHTQRGQFDKAEVMFHKALTLAQKENDEDAITYIYDMLANLAFETGDGPKAEKLFVSLLQRLLSKGEPQDSNKVVHISLKLAKIFQDRKDFKKAEQGFTFCLETLEQKMQQQENMDEDTLALWGMNMDWYARFLLDAGRKNESLDCFKKAYEMCVKINGMEHEQTVILLNDLGTVSSLMGDTETAMTYFEQARDIGSKLPEMKDLAAIFINLGQLYLLREMYNESKAACEHGLNRAKAVNDEVASSEALQCLESIKKVFNDTNRGKEFKLVDSKGSGFQKAELIK